MRAVSSMTGWKRWPVVPLLLWSCLWLNLNSGFWEIQVPESAGDWLLLFRAVAPFVALAVAALLLLGRGQIRLDKWGPSRLLLLYGSVAAFATVFSPGPGAAAYWSVAFLATMLVARSFALKKDPVGATRLLLEITWAATFIVAAIIAYQGRGDIFGDAASGYGISAELHDTTRSSGVARWAAVPGLVCLVRAFYTRRVALIGFYLGIAGVAFYIVYRMQSRGAVFGAAAALGFALLVSGRLRRYALPFAVVAVVGLVLYASPQGAENQVSTYLHRGQSDEEFRSMTGRTRAYEHGMEAFTDAPIFGRGQWADRMIIGEHVHNSFLQAMLNGGAIGALPYFASWIAGWLLFVKLNKRRARLAPEDRRLLLECGTVMMFFTVRAIPETTTASYAVDLLVMAAVYVYMETMWSVVKASRRRALVRFPQPVIACGEAWAVNGIGARK